MAENESREGNCPGSMCPGFFPQEFLGPKKNTKKKLRSQMPIDTCSGIEFLYIKDSLLQDPIICQEDTSDSTGDHCIPYIRERYITYIASWWWNITVPLRCFRNLYVRNSRRFFNHFYANRYLNDGPSCSKSWDFYLRTTRHTWGCTFVTFSVVTSRPNLIPDRWRSWKKHLQRSRELTNQQKGSRIESPCTWVFP